MHPKEQQRLDQHLEKIKTKDLLKLLVRFCFPFICFHRNSFFVRLDISMVENTPNDNYNLQNKKFKTVTMTYDFKKEFELKNIDEEDDDEKYFKEYSNKHDDGQYAKTIYKKKFQDEVTTNNNHLFFC